MGLLVCMLLRNRGSFHGARPMNSVPESTYSYTKRHDDVSFFLEEFSYNLDSFYFDHLVDMTDMFHLGSFGYYSSSLFFSIDYSMLTLLLFCSI